MILKVLKNILKMKNIEFFNVKSKLDSVAIPPEQAPSLYTTLVQIGLVIADQAKLKTWFDKIPKSSIIHGFYGHFILHKGESAVFINSLREGNKNIIHIYELPLNDISALLSTKGLELSDYLVYLPITGHIRLVETNPANVERVHTALRELSTSPKQSNFLILCNTQFNLSVPLDSNGAPLNLTATLDVAQFGSRKIQGN
jgi:hypothetical protein